MAGGPDTFPDPHHKLSQAEIDTLAVDQHLRGASSTDEMGNPKFDIEHSPDAAMVAGRMALIDTETPPAPQFGDDDTEDFRRAQLDGGIYIYD
ncbi:MAG TPA: hypothetical protein VLE69_02260 [Candidatus Saccharimonadales bacterium]|nr:hypothetical protein [Candidatus Saccharimonadales bacterium]